MKHIYKLFPILLLLYSCIFSPDNNSAKIKSLTQYEFEITGIDTLSNVGEDPELSYILGDTVAVHQQLFNRNGMLIEETSTYRGSYPKDSKKIYEYYSNNSVSLYEYYVDSELEWKCTFRKDKQITYLSNYDGETEYFYNRSGNIEKIIHSTYDWDSLSVYETRYEYDPKGNINRVIWYSDNYAGESLNTVDAYDNYYDDQNRISKIDHAHYSYTSDIPRMSFTERNYSYNDNGYEVRESSVYQGRYVGRRIYIYNNENELLKRTSYDENDHHTSTITDFYLNNDYKILEFASLDSNDILLGYGNEYVFDNDNLTQIINNWSGESKTVLNVEYDNNGNVTEYRCVDLSYYKRTPAEFSLEDFDEYFTVTYIYPTRYYYYYNRSEMKYMFDSGHYIFYNYDENGIWESKVQFNLERDREPQKIFFQEYELY